MRIPAFFRTTLIAAVCLAVAVAVVGLSSPGIAPDARAPEAVGPEAVGEGADATPLETPKLRVSPSLAPTPSADPIRRDVSDPDSQCGALPPAPAGWERRVTSAFREETPLGSWPGPVAALDWQNRTAGWRDSSRRGIYDSGKTVSEHDGLLDVWVHSEGDSRYVAAPLPKLGNVRGMRVSVCMRADRIPGYKIAFLLWPQGTEDKLNNNLGEIDFPEGSLLPDSEVTAFVHYAPRPEQGRTQESHPSGVSSEDWHLYVIEWDPGSPTSQEDDYVTFLVDGRRIGRTTGPGVPDGPMHYVMQIETYLKGRKLPPPAEGHVLIDWVTIDVPDRADSSGD